jgi:protein-S-isoprenylcysteine O-methyltransferase Ste14
MDELRHVLALLVLLAAPITLGVWLLIHPLARTWRRIGPLGTYATLTLPAAALGLVLWSKRATLLGADLGSEPVLLAVGVAALAAALALGLVRRRQLGNRILVGVPELSREPGRLVTEGVYARMRNPRYVEYLLSVLGWVAIANHMGTWALFVLSFPLVHLVVLLEERELRDRFGAAYEAYRRRVPRYLPRRSPWA